MAKFNFNITLHLNEDDSIAVLYSRDFDYNPTLFASVLEMAEVKMNSVKWSLDDGDDNGMTDYCQYVAYVGNEDYLLASFNEIDPVNGCIKYK